MIFSRIYASADTVYIPTEIEGIFVCICIGKHEILLREVSENEVVDMFTNGTVSVPEILVEQLLRKVSREEAFTNTSSLSNLLLILHH